MDSKIILVDCDNVLINLNDAWIKELNKIYNTDYVADDIKDWDFSNLFPNATMTELLEILGTHLNIWENVKPIAGSIKYLRRLVEDGHQIYIVTATDYRNLKIKVENVFIKYFPFIPIENIIICNNKHLICGDILIDDHIANLNGGIYKKFLFTQSYNKDIMISRNWYRVNNWKQIYNLINKLYS